MLGERETEREKDGSDVTLVALELAMSLHFSLPKICILVPPLANGTEFTLSVAKNVAALFETVCTLRFASLKWRDR